MNKLRIISLLLLIALLTSGFADGVKITINNKTGETFWMTFSGPTTVYHQATAGKTTVLLPKGTYKYTYFACGKNNEEKLNVKKEETLVLKCTVTKGEDDAKSSKIKITVNNQTGAAVWLTFTGQATVYHQAPAGKSTVELAKGTYKYTYFACGKNNEVKLNVKKAETIQIKCGGSKDKDDKDGKTITLKVQNNTGGLLTLVLSGPQSYNFTLGTGMNKITIVPGNYNYTVWAGCGSASGTKKLSGGLIWTWWCY